MSVGDLRLMFGLIEKHVANGNWACHRGFGQHVQLVTPVFSHQTPVSKPAHMWLNLPRHWQVALWSGIGRSPQCFLWLITPWSHTLLPLEPSVCFGNCVWQAKEQAIYVKCEGGSIPFPSDSCHLIWYQSTAKLGGVQRGPDLLVFVPCCIAVMIAASGRCLVHYCICFFVVFVQRLLWAVTVSREL